MLKKSEPWYLHIGLTVVIIVLLYVLIQVAYYSPKKVIDSETYWKTESRIRMNNIREAEILWKKKYNRFTASVDSLIQFVRTDETAQKIINGYDTLNHKPTNPFDTLWSGILDFDSLRVSPKSHQPYLLQVDRSTKLDTVVDRYGKIRGIDSTVVFGSRYYLECPDGYGTIGDIEKDAKINTASWD